MQKIKYKSDSIRIYVGCLFILWPTVKAEPEGKMQYEIMEMVF